MPLLKEYWPEQFVERVTLSPDESQRLQRAQLATGAEALRSMYEILMLKSIMPKDKHKTPRAYYLQPGLPPNHEVAAWFNLRHKQSIRLLTQVVRWEGEELDNEVNVSARRVRLHRTIGEEVVSMVPGVNNLDVFLSFDERMQIVRDTHETINFVAQANGYTDTRPIDY